ncbi:MAG: hypothetical protein OEV64_03240 [Desulfobulbaceae bacterium]|nr:hypothetical protein [Desulfobulbaceae bacterium]
MEEQAMRPVKNDGGKVGDARHSSEPNPARLNREMYQNVTD